MLPKFIEDCNQLLAEGAVDSVRCMGLCGHSTWMPAYELSANDSEETTATFKHPADIMYRERCTKLIWKLHPKPNTVSEIKVVLEKTPENFPQNKADPCFRNRLRESTWSLVEDILSICSNSKKCSHLWCLHLSWTLSVSIF